MLAAARVVCGMCFRLSISIQGHAYVLMLKTGDFMPLASILCIIDFAVPGREHSHVALCYLF